MASSNERSRCGNGDLARWVRVSVAVMAVGTVAPAWSAAADSPAAVAEPRATQSKSRTAATEAPRATRADLARVYLRFEKTLQANPPATERLAEVNQAFDRATLAFFSGKSTETIRVINELTASLQTGRAGAAEAMAAALRVRIEPPVGLLGSSATPRAQIYALYAQPTQDDAALKLMLELAPLSGGEPVQFPFAVQASGEERFQTQLELSALAGQSEPATFQLSIVGDGRPGEAAVRIPAGKWSLVSRSLEQVRAENESRLAALQPDVAELAEPLAICRARNALLSSSPTEENSAEFLADPNRLLAEIETEIQALEAGQNPYRRRAGDTWRIVVTEKKPLPVRVYAPASACGEQPVPLVIALHGAGGDENMFLEGYGAGRIKTLADEHGFLLASPRTTSKAETFDQLVQSLVRDYAVDISRVYVLGHSMGGGATAALAGTRGEKICAACCLAGSRGFSQRAKLPPVLVIAAELDLVVPPGSIEEGAQRAIAAGQPVEFRKLPSFGHTLMVGELLPQVVKWLLAHRP